MLNQNICGLAVGSRLVALIIRACSVGLAEEQDVHKGVYGVVFCSTREAVVWLQLRKFTDVLLEK